MNIIVLESVGSTNVEAKREAYHHGDAIVALHQTDGRGQRGHRWDSRAGENLTFSVVWEPTFLAAVQQFLLSEAVALAIVDTLGEYGIESRIKWTNDIYVGDKKICGVLIENSLNGDRMARSVVGIGLNVNQTEFDEWVPNPTSLKLSNGADYDTMAVLNRLCAALERRYEVLTTNPKQIAEEYNALIYRRDESHLYALPDGSRFEGIIKRVEASGHLVVFHDGNEEHFAFKEIEFII